MKIFLILVVILFLRGEILYSQEQFENGSSISIVDDLSLNITRISSTDGDHVEMGDVLNMGTQDFTLEFKVSVDSFPLAPGSKIINKGLTANGAPPRVGYGVRVIDDGGVNKILFLIHDGTSLYTTEITGLEVGTCYHIAAVRQDSSIKLYLDGIGGFSGTTNGIIDLNTNLFFSIGDLCRKPIFINIDSEFFDGRVNEVRVWNFARSQQQIQSTKNDTLGFEYYSTLDSGLIAYYRLDEFEDLGFGDLGTNDVRDMSANGFHGDSFGTPDFVASCQTVGVDDESNLIPNKIELMQNYPNPFNPATTIRYNLTKRSHIKLIVYDMLGKEVDKLVDEEQASGNYEINFNPEGLSSGIYFYRIISDSFIETKKMVLIK